MKKRIWLTAVAVLSAAALTACGGKQAEAPQTTAAETKAEGAQETTEATASEEPVTIRFCWWGGDSRHAATEKAVQAFMEKYPISPLNVNTAHGLAGRKASP